jgi:hypothetical protein
VNATEEIAMGEVERTLDREVELLMSAVLLVASGGAPSTTVAGLRLAEAAMAIVLPRAVERGLIMEALWGPDEWTCDVRVRRPPTE